MASVREAPPVRRHRWTVADYHRLAEAGILGEDDRVELIEGELYEMAPIGSRHAGAVDWILSKLSEMAGGRAIVRCQSPIRLGERSEPQPDLALLRPRADWYRDAHPGPEDVLLVVEVADTTAGWDREVKFPLYARHGIPEAWLVDLEAGRLEIHRGPGPEGYRRIERLPLAEARALEPEALAGARLDLSPLA